MMSRYRAHEPQDSHELRIFLERIGCLGKHLGGIYLRGWRDLESNVRTLAPEFATHRPLAINLAFRLTPSEVDRTLSRDLDTIYSLNDDLSLAACMLATIRHSEMASVFMPDSTPRPLVAQTVRHADHLSFSLDESCFSTSLRWVLGSMPINEDPDGIYLVTHDDTLFAEVSEILEKMSER